MIKKWIVLIVVILLFGCGSKQREINGINMNQGILVESIDSTGWFNDGEIHEQYDFSKHPIKSLPHNFIPLDNISQRLLDDYFHKELFNNIEEGYYCIIDQQKSSNKSSMNIEMIIYDLKTNQLYYMILNT